MREQFDRRFRRAEGRDAGAFEQQSCLTYLLFAHPAGHDRLVGIAREFGNAARRLGGIGHRLRCEDHQDAVDLIVGETCLGSGGVARRVGITDDVERIVFRPGFREDFVQFRQRGFRQRGQRNAEVAAMVRGHDAGAAAIGNDREAVAARTEMREQRLGSRIHLANRPQAHHAGATQRGVEDVVGAGNGARVRARSPLAGRMLADLDQQHGLAARRGAQCAHEAAGVLDAFDVEENVLRLGVGDHVLENFAEVHVAFGA